MSSEAASRDRSQAWDSWPRVFAAAVLLLLLWWAFWLLRSWPALQQGALQGSDLASGSIPSLVFSSLWRRPHTPHSVMALSVVSHAILLVWLAVIFLRAGRPRPQPPSAWLFGITILALFVTPLAVASLEGGSPQAMVLLETCAAAMLARRLVRSPPLPLSLLAGASFWAFTAVLLRVDLLLLATCASLTVGLSFLAGRSRRMVVEHPGLGTAAALAPLVGGLAATGVYFLAGLPMLTRAGAWHTAPAYPGDRLFGILLCFLSSLSFLALLAFDRVWLADLAANTLLLASVVTEVSSAHHVFSLGWPLTFPLLWNVLRLAELDTWRHMALEPVLRTCLALFALLLALLALWGARHPTPVLHP